MPSFVVSRDNVNIIKLLVIACTKHASYYGRIYCIATNHLRVVLVQLSLFYRNKVCLIKGRNSPVTVPYACLETLL